MVRIHSGTAHEVECDGRSVGVRWLHPHPDSQVVQEGDGVLTSGVGDCHSCLLHTQLACVGG